MEGAPQHIMTNRLTLRPPSRGDRRLWVTLYRDPSLWQHEVWAMAASDADAVHSFTECLERWERAGFDYDVVEETSTRKGIGVGGLSVRAAPSGEDVLDLDYRLTAQAHGRGLATEAVRAWTAHALEWLPDLPVVASCRAANTRAVRTAVTAGLEAVGTVDDAPGDEPPSTLLRAPRVEAAASFDPQTRESLLDLWVAVNDAGGAVGFLPRAARSQVARALDAHEQSMADGATTAVLLRGAGGRVVGAGFWVADRNPLLAHSRTAYRVMTHPDLRGRNLGRLLLAAMHRVARESGVEVAVLDVRSGLGTTRFYEASGYVEVGRIPGVIRVGAGDDRDSVLMARRLDGRPMVADGRA